MNPKNKSHIDFAGDVRMFLDDNIKSRWQPDVKAVNANDDDTTINIYDVIGYDYWTGEGMTSKIVNSVLRKNKGKAITVNINSPGGDFFEGVAIYNLLKEHDGDVNVRIIGIAASAASVIAMAGDTIKIAESGFLMIHNAWSICLGNANEMRDSADVLDQFDESMRGVYSKQTGISTDEIKSMMDGETWISGADCLEKGFATALLDSDNIDVDESPKSKYNSSLKEVEDALAKAGKTRSERRGILSGLTSLPCADVEKSDHLPCADQNTLGDAFASLNKILTIKD